MRPRSTRTNRRNAALTVGAVLVGLAATGCGDDDDENTPAGPPPLATKSIGAYKFDDPAVARDADAARRATGRYLNEPNARADGYDPQPEARPVCTKAKGGNGAIEYVNSGLVDGKLDVREPEVLLYEPTKDGARRLVGLQYRLGEGDQGGRIFNRDVKGRLNVWVYLFNAQGLFAEGNRASTCKPGPAPEITARRPQDGPPPGSGGPPPGAEGGGGGGGGASGGPPPGQ